MNRVVIGLGSNVDPETHVGRAIERMRRCHRLLLRSTLRWTRPVGKTDQPDFLNGAVLIETDLGREDLVAWLKRVEADLGRVRSADRNGPRTIDLDLLVWNGRLVDEDVRERDFVRDAVREVLPEANLGR